MKFYASVRIDIRKTEPIKVGSEIVGNSVKCKIVKNKVAPPFKVATFDIMYGEGISKYGELVDIASEYGIIKKSGTWFSYGENRIGQGKEKAKEFLMQNDDIANEVEKLVREKLAEATDTAKDKQAKTVKEPVKQPEAKKTAAAKPATSSLDVTADDFE